MQCSKHCVKVTTLQVTNWNSQTLGKWACGQPAIMCLHKIKVAFGLLPEALINSMYFLNILGCNWILEARAK